MGVKERRAREKIQRREEILETTRRLFHERGFLNVTMSEIAETAEVSIGTLYLYFKNKEDIYAGLACLGSQKIDEMVGHALGLGKKLNHKTLLSFIESFLRIYNDYGCYFDILLLNFKGKGAINLSDGYAQTLRDTTQSSLAKSISYFASRFPNKPDKERAARATTFAIWAFLLGLTQLLDVGRTDLFDEEDISRLLSKAADLLRDIPLELTAR